MASSRYPTIVVRRIPDMAVRIEKDGPVWTVIHDRPEARNAMDPASADALTAAFLEFDADKDAFVAVFYGAGGAFCAGWDLKYVSTLDADYPLGELDISTERPRGNGGEIPRGPLGPSRLELDKPVIAAIEGPAVAGGMELGLWCDFRVMAEESYFGVYCRRWRHGAVATHCGAGPRARDYPDGTQSACRGVHVHRLVRIPDPEGRRTREGRSPRTGARALSAGLCPCRQTVGHQEPWPYGSRGADSGVVQRTRGINRRRRGGGKPLQRGARPARRFCENSLALRPWCFSDDSGVNDGGRTRCFPAHRAFAHV